MTPRLSFEFFPPQSVEASFHLWDSVQALAPFGPDFVSVTYGAGGTTRKLTHEAVTAIEAHAHVPVAAHLTCVGASQAETLAVADAYRSAGVRQIVALRGDPAQGAAQFTPHPDGFATSVDLVRALADRGFEVTVGAYPDRHPEAADHQADIDWLKRKIDAGATRAIIQFFFEADTFLRFRDRCAAAGITAELIPGLLPIHNWAKVRRFARRCGATVPSGFEAAFAKAKGRQAEDLLSLCLATELASDLIDNEVGHLHFYTLNRPDLTRDVCRALGIPTHQPLQKVA